MHYTKKESAMKNSNLSPEERKARKNERNRLYRLEHKEQLREYNRRYLASHPNWEKEYREKYEKENSEIIKIHKQQYYLNKKEEMNLKSKAWYDSRKNDPIFKEQKRLKRIENKRQYLFNAIKNRAKKRGIEFDIQPSDIHDLFISQGNVCAISKIKFDEYSAYYSSSVDRIDSNRGYVKGNIQLVCSVVNTMKLDLDMVEFRSIISKIYKSIA
jgi:hypothetical protein